jgi:hypothetical protein
LQRRIVGKRQKHRRVRGTVAGGAGATETGAETGG